jgi:hypothetical protein
MSFADHVSLGIETYGNCKHNAQLILTGNATGVLFGGLSVSTYNSPRSNTNILQSLKNIEQKQIINLSQDNIKTECLNITKSTKHQRPRVAEYATIFEQ